MSVHDCPMPDMRQFCKCSGFFPYEGYYIVHLLAMVVFIAMAVLYSATFLRIYISGRPRTNVGHFIQVFDTLKISFKTQTHESNTPRPNGTNRR